MHCETVGFIASRGWQSHSRLFDVVVTSRGGSGDEPCGSYAGDGAARTPGRSLNTGTDLGSGRAVVVLRQLAIRPNLLEQKGTTVTATGISSGNRTSSSIPTRVR